VTYISLCRHLIQISIVQSEEQHVVNHLPKFHLNRSVNESGNTILRKLHKLEKYVTPSAHKLKAWRLAVSKLRPAVPAARKVRKNSVFHSVCIAWQSHPCRQAVLHKKKKNPKLGYYSCVAWWYIQIR